MKRIKVKGKINESSYDNMVSIWRKHKDVIIQIEKFASDELVNNIAFLLKRTSEKFASVLLSDIASQKNLTLQQLKEIFLKGDVSCKVSICLRDDLDNELRLWCTNSSEQIVSEHYKVRNANT